MAKILDLIGLGMPWQQAILLGDDAPQRPTTSQLMGVGFPPLLADALGNNVASSTPALLVQLGFPAAHAAAVTLTPQALTILGVPGSYTAGTAASFVPTVVGGAAPYSFSLSGSLPNGWSFSSATGAISIPSSATAGTVSGLSITVTDSKGATAVLGPFSLVVQASGGGGGPLAIAGVMPNAIVAQSYSWAPTISGGKPPYSVARSGFNSITGNFDATTGTFSGPFSASAAYTSGSLVVTDSLGAQATLSNLTFSIYPVWANNNEAIAVGNSLIDLASNGVGTKGASGTDGSATISTTIVHNTGALSSLLKGFGWKIRPSRFFCYGNRGATSLQALKALNSSSCLATGNQANTTTGVPSDVNFWPLNNGAASPIANPAGTVIMYDWDNDYISATSTGDAAWANQLNPSINTAMLMFDQFGMAGKRVIAATGHPRGTGVALWESLTINSSTGQGTPVNSGFVSEMSDVGAVPAGALVLTNTGATGAQAAGFVLTRVANGTTLAAGQYSINPSTGVYSTFPGDGIATMSVSYLYAPGTARGNGQQRAQQLYRQFCNWLLSNAPQFTDPDTGTVFSVPGARYKFPHLFPVDTYSGFVDPATTPATTGSFATATMTNKPGADIDGLHFGSRGAQLGRIAAANVNAFPELSTQLKKAAGTSRQAFNGSSSTTTYNFTLPPAMRNQALGLVLRGDGQNFVVPANSSTFTPSGNLTSGSVNWSTGAVTVTLSTGPTAASFWEATQDQTSFLINPGFDTGQGNGTVNGSFTASAVPAFWDLRAGGTMPGVTLSNSLGTDSQGNPAIVITGSGQQLTTTNTSVSLGQTLKAFTKRMGSLTGQIAGSMHIEISKGPNGHIAGIVAPNLALNLKSTAAVQRPAQNTSTGGTTTLGTTTHQATIDLAYSSNNSSAMTDLDLVEGAVNGVIAYDVMTPPILMDGITVQDDTSPFLTMTMGILRGSVVDFTLKISLPNLYTVA